MLMTLKKKQKKKLSKLDPLMSRACRWAQSCKDYVHCFTWKESVEEDALLSRDCECNYHLARDKSLCHTRFVRLAYYWFLSREWTYVNDGIDRSWRFRGWEVCRFCHSQQLEIDILKYLSMEVKQSRNKIIKWVWPGNAIITEYRPTDDTAERKRHPKKRSKQIHMITTKQQ